MLAREIAPPQGEKAVEWRLLTNCLASTLDAARELSDWYRCRWEIEVFHKSLKSNAALDFKDL